MTNESLAASGAQSAGLRNAAVVSGRIANARATFTAPIVVGTGVCVAGMLVCAGAWAPWFSISLFSVKANIGGLNSHLDGGYALVLGVIGFGLGATLLRMPQRASVRRVAAAALVLLGAGGVFMVWHQYVQLSHNASRIGRTSGLTPFAKYFDVHAGAAWGLWLTGASFLCFVVAGALVPIANRNR